MKNLEVNEKVMVELSKWGVVMWKRHAFNKSESGYNDPYLKEIKFKEEMSKLHDDTLETSLYEIMSVFGEYLDDDPELYPFKSGIKIKEKRLKSE